MIKVDQHKLFYAKPLDLAALLFRSVFQDVPRKCEIRCGSQIFMGNSPSHFNGTHSKQPSVMSQNVKDVSMVDISEAVNESQSDAQSQEPSTVTQSMSQMNIDDGNELTPQTSTSRKSTLIFDDDFDETTNQHKHIENQGTYNDDIILEDHDDEDPVNNVLVQTAEGSTSSSDTSSAVEDQNERRRAQAPAYESRIQEGQFNKTSPQQIPTTDQQYQHQPQQPQLQDRRPIMVPVDITWQQGGSKVYVTGSFTGWRKMIGLVPDNNNPGVFHIKLQLPPGTHRFRFIVDNELRFSDFLPTATDQMGNFVNYFEISPPDSMDMMHYDMSTQQQIPTQRKHDHISSSESSKQGQQASQTLPPQVRRQPSQSKDGKLSARSQLALHIEEDPDDMGNGYTRFKEEHQLKPDFEYTQDIPAVFTDPSVMEQYYLTLDQQQNNQQNMSWLTPPQLPPQLENVILNNYNKNAVETGSENNSGALPIPNHVVLNHLATSSIKHNTLCVASIVRYKRKYATQILYAPLQ